MLTRSLRFITPAGLLFQGRHLADLEPHLAGPPMILNQSCVTWNLIVGKDSALEITPDVLHAEIRRYFSWRDLLIRATTALIAYGASRGVAAETQRRLTVAAFADSWPATIEQWQDILCAVHRAGRHMIAVGEQGLLWLIVNALEEPWEQAANPLESDAADLRFARLAMVASDGMGPPAKFLSTLPRPPNHANSEIAAFTTTHILLASGRLTERDDIIRWLVRAYELYVELLPQFFPAAGSIFESSKHVDIETWIVQICALVNMLEQEAGPPPRRKPILNFRSADPGERQAVRDVVSHLAATRERYKPLMEACRRRAADQSLAFEPLRNYPILELNAYEYLVLHDDFLLAASDDGVWSTIADAVPREHRRAFLTKFGEALEAYVERILLRIADQLRDSTLARVPTVEQIRARGGAVQEVASDAKRCDFAWRVGDDLVLLDSKRIGLRSELLMGDTANIDKRLIDEFGHGCRQLCATKRAIDIAGIHNVVPDLTAPTGWAPARVFGIVVSHRPMFMWYSSPPNLLSESMLETVWQSNFRGLPTFWSLSDLELLEAAVSHEGSLLTKLLGSIDRKAPHVSTGMPGFLIGEGYVGPVASPYYARKRTSILSLRR